MLHRYFGLLKDRRHKQLVNPHTHTGKCSYSCTVKSDLQLVKAGCSTEEFVWKTHQLVVKEIPIKKLFNLNYKLTVTEIELH